MDKYNKQSKSEKEREKTKTIIIAGVFTFALLSILLLVWVGISSPYGLENFFKSLWGQFLDFLAWLRFKLDIFFRFFKSIFER